MCLNTKDDNSPWSSFKIKLIILWLHYESVYVTKKPIKINSQSKISFKHKQ